MTNVTVKTASLVWLLAGLSIGALPQAAQNSPSAEALYQQLQTVGLDKTRVYTIREAELDRGAVHFSLEDGTIAFTADVDGRITGALFHGDGEILLQPADSTERGSLAFFTGAAILEEKFATAYFRFNDDVFSELKNSLRPPEEAENFASDFDATAKNLAAEDALRLLVSFVDSAPSSAERADHFIHAYLVGEKLGTFDVRYDSMSPEQVSAGAHRTVQGEDFYDVWTSFSPKTKGKPTLDALRADDFEITDFKITARIDPPTHLAAQATLSVTARSDGLRVLLFELSRLLQLKQVEADGTPVEFIHNPSIQGSQLEKMGNDLVAVILSAPTRAGQKVTLSFDYGGAVLSEAADGLLYVGEHGTWYPNVGLKKANFELEFHYPQAWTLVATGRPTKQTNAGAEQISQWISTRPIPVAGFNLGRYSRQETRTANVSVLTYATANVERGFPPLSEDASATPTFLGNKPPLAMDPDLSPSPAHNTQAVGREAARALDFYQQRFGPFPYSQLSLTQFPGHVSQGWPGLIFLASYAFLTPPERERFQPDAKLRLALEQTTAHEVAHQWWGDLVSWSGYRDQWLMEALANYSALMLLESRNPAAFHELLRKYRDDLLAKNHKGEQLSTAGPVTLGLRLSSSQFPNGYEAISYGRGTWMIHMLRCMMRDGERKSGAASGAGDAAFLRALRKLRADYDSKPASTADFLSEFEPELPKELWYEGRKSLDWFYEGWVNGTSIPEFSVRDVKFAEHGANIVTGTIMQEHAPESLVTAVPVYASVGGRNVFLARVFAEGRETHFRLTAPAGTSKLVLDPEMTLLSQK